MAIRGTDPLKWIISYGVGAIIWGAMNFVTYTQGGVSYIIAIPLLIACRFFHKAWEKRSPTNLVVGLDVEAFWINGMALILTIGGILSILRITELVFDWRAPGLAILGAAIIAIALFIGGKKLV